MSVRNRHIDQYVAPDSTVLYHYNDKALKPIRLSLPRPPRFELIDGYGLPAKEQKFKRHKYPDKLRRLEELSLQVIKDLAENDKSYTATLFKVQKEFWDTLSKRRDYYDDEIKWMQKTWWHILNGYWFFNNGKPTYITGWHYFYLNFWMIDGQFFPDYRDRDRKEFLFFHYSYTTTETFEKIDDKGFAIPEEDGSYKMIDTGNRVCYGVGQNKNRRSGNTNKGLCIVYLITITHRGKEGGGIMSMSGESSEGHMKDKLVPAWRKMPFMVKPLTSSSNDPKAIVNKAPRTELGTDDLGNSISAAGTSDAKFYDGKGLWCILVDESGKAKNLDVRERTGVLLHCIAQGNGAKIHGWMYQPSTADELTKGGEAYKGLLDDGNFYRRNPLTGRTTSGIFRLFIPADEGLDGFIDEYGYSVKGSKLSKQHKEAGFRYTATQSIEAERTQLRKDLERNPGAALNLRVNKKQFPLCYDDSWVGSAGNIGFDSEGIDNRLAELPRLFEPTQRGNFEWSNGQFGSRVVWKPSPDGRWLISLVLRDEETNQKYSDYEYDELNGVEKEVFRPKNPDRFTCGADPYNFVPKAKATTTNSSTGSNTSSHSDGGIAVFWHLDEKLDPETKPIREWESNRFVCTYRYRHGDNVKYAEDVLKTCLYYGAMCFPEVNVRIVWEKFREWGYDGFLKYQIDERTMKPKDYPGVQSLERSKMEGFEELRNHIALHIGREVHEDLILEWKNIGSIDEMTKYDLLAASMCAKLGAKSIHSKLEDKENEKSYDLASAFFR